MKIYTLDQKILDLLNEALKDFESCPVPLLETKNYYLCLKACHNQATAETIKKVLKEMERLNGLSGVPNSISPECIFSGDSMLQEIIRERQTIYLYLKELLKP